MPYNVSFPASGSPTLANRDFADTLSKTYTSILQAEALKTGGLFEPYIAERPVRGDKAQAFSELKRLHFSSLNTRLAETELQDLGYNQRWAFFRRKVLATAVDIFDDPQHEIRPDSAISLSILRAYGEMRDADVLEATLGTSQSGPDGMTAVASPTDSKSVLGNTNMAPDNAVTMDEDALVNISVLLMDKGIAIGRETVLLVMTPRIFGKFSKLDVVKNLDFNAGRPTAPQMGRSLMYGLFPVVYPSGDDNCGSAGGDWTRLRSKTTSNTAVDECVAIATRHFIRATWMPLSVVRAERSDLNMAKQWHAAVATRCVRLNEDCMVRAYLK